VKGILRMLILLCALISYFSLMFSVNATGQVNILTHSGWLDGLGYYHVVGEVQNVGSSTVDFVQVTATFYNSSNTVIAVDYTYTTLSVILPGRKSPFEIILTDTTQSAKVYTYSLGVTYSATSSIPMELEMLSNSSYVDGIGDLHVVGNIKNVGSENSTFTQVIATFYNSTGTVVATAYTYSNPDTITPSQTAPFEIILDYTNRVPLVASYALTAESAEYAFVPEFPTPFIPLSLLAGSLLIALTYGKTRHPNAISND